VLCLVRDAWDDDGKQKGLEEERSGGS